MPESGLDYRPPPTSRCTRDLLGHVLGPNLDVIELLDEGTYRGQLTTYLRPMGSKVTAIYGPSADDQGEAH